MNRTVFTILVVCLAFAGAGVLAQDEEATESYVYGTYYVCDPAGEDRADEIVASLWQPIYDAAVEDGTITGWGWLAHHTGGRWRRVAYFSAPDVPALLAAQNKIGPAIRKASGESGEFVKICNTHDDYIWRGVAGSGGNVLATTRGKVGMSAYHVCTMSMEGRADELVKTVMAPVYDAHVGEGKLRSWGWSSHIVGGEYRRLATMTADDWPTLLAMRASILEAMQGNPLAMQFSDICGSHSDYMWELRIENP